MLGEYGDLAGLPQADRRVEGRPPILERRNDDRRPQRHGARDGPLEADLERGSARVGADRRVHIRQRGACAPKRHFHVRASAPLCAWLSYSCGTAAGAATPLWSFRPKKGATPPFGMPRSASGRVRMCTSMPPSAGGSLPFHQSLAGRLLSADPLGWCRSGRGQGSHQLSPIAPPVHELKKSPPDFVVRIDDEERPVAHAAPVVGHRAARELVLQPPDLVEMAT